MITGCEGAKRADYKTNRRGMIFENEKQHEDDRGDHADGDDLPIQICFCAFLDCGRNLTHLFVASRGAAHDRDQAEGKRQPNYGAYHRQWHARIENR